jgi:hypothetical protein
LVFPIPQHLTEFTMKALPIAVILASLATAILLALSAMAPGVFERQVRTYSAERAEAESRLVREVEASAALSRDNLAAGIAGAPALASALALGSTDPNGAINAIRQLAEEPLRLQDPPVSAIVLVDPTGGVVWPTNDRGTLSATDFVDPSGVRAAMETRAPHARFFRVSGRIFAAASRPVIEPTGGVVGGVVVVQEYNARTVQLRSPGFGADVTYFAGQDVLGSTVDDEAVLSSVSDLVRRTSADDYGLTGEGGSVSFAELPASEGDLSGSGRILCLMPFQLGSSDGGDTTIAAVLSVEATRPPGSLLALLVAGRAFDDGTMTLWMYAATALLIALLLIMFDTWSLQRSVDVIGRRIHEAGVMADHQQLDIEKLPRLVRGVGHTFNQYVETMRRKQSLLVSAASHAPAVEAPAAPTSDNEAMFEPVPSDIFMPLAPAGEPSGGQFVAVAPPTVPVFTRPPEPVTPPADEPSSVSEPFISTRSEAVPLAVRPALRTGETEAVAEFAPVSEIAPPAAVAPPEEVVTASTATEPPVEAVAPTPAGLAPARLRRTSGSNPVIEGGLPRVGPPRVPPPEVGGRHGTMAMPVFRPSGGDDATGDASIFDRSEMTLQQYAAPPRESTGEQTAVEQTAPESLAPIAVPAPFDAPAPSDAAPAAADAAAAPEAAAAEPHGVAEELPRPFEESEPANPVFSGEGFEERPRTFEFVPLVGSAPHSDRVTSPNRTIAGMPAIAATGFIPTDRELGDEIMSAFDRVASDPRIQLSGRFATIPEAGEPEPDAAAPSRRVSSVSGPVPVATLDSMLDSLDAASPGPDEAPAVDGDQTAIPGVTDVDRRASEALNEEGTLREPLGDMQASQTVPRAEIPQVKRPDLKPEDDILARAEQRLRALRAPAPLQPPASSRTPAAGVPPVSAAPVDINRVLFDRFVAARRECGESVEGLTVEKFAVKLDSNRVALVERFKCRDVKFDVQIVNGKATLKATPVR